MRSIDKLRQWFIDKYEIEYPIDCSWGDVLEYVRQFGDPRTTIAWQKAKEADSK